MKLSANIFSKSHKKFWFFTFFTFSVLFVCLFVFETEMTTLSVLCFGLENSQKLRENAKMYSNARKSKHIRFNIFCLFWFANVLSFTQKFKFRFIYVKSKTTKKCYCENWRSWNLNLMKFQILHPEMIKISVWRPNCDFTENLLISKLCCVKKIPVSKLPTLSNFCVGARGVSEASGKITWI